MSTYLDRIKAYHEQVIRAGIAAGNTAATMRLSLDLEYKWRAYTGCRDRAREARAEKRMAAFREQAAKSCQHFRHFIQTVRSREDGMLALALMREREGRR